MAKRQNLLGKTFGRLTVLEKDEIKSKEKHRAYWKCQCSCGNIKTVCGLSLIRNETQSCGCLRNEKVFEAIAKDELGKRYGKLLVIKMDDNRDNYGRIKWICQCDCGNIVSVTGAYLRNGNTTSCGCSHLGVSKGETKIEQLLIENNYSFIREYKDVVHLGQKRFDFAILNDTNEIIRLIEFDGEQHFHNSRWSRDKLFRTQESDAIKNQYALMKKIPLVRIPYWELENLTLEMLFSDKFLVKEK